MSSEDIKKRIAQLKNNSAISNSLKIPLNAGVVDSTTSISKLRVPLDTATSTTIPAPTSLAAKMAAKKLTGLVNIPAAHKAEQANPTRVLPNIEQVLEITKDMDTLEGFNPKEFLDLLPNLAAAIEVRAPGIAGYVQQINTQLNEHEELTYILNNDQLNIICSGLLFLTNSNMADAVSKSRGTRILSLTESTAMFT